MSNYIPTKVKATKRLIFNILIYSYGDFFASQLPCIGPPSLWPSYGPADSTQCWQRFQTICFSRQAYGQHRWPLPIPVNIDCLTPILSNLPWCRDLNFSLTPSKHNVICTIFSDSKQQFGVYHIPPTLHSCVRLLSIYTRLILLKSIRKLHYSCPMLFLYSTLWVQ